MFQYKVIAVLHIQLHACGSFNEPKIQYALNWTHLGDMKHLCPREVLFSARVGLCSSRVHTPRGLPEHILWPVVNSEHKAYFFPLVSRTATQPATALTVAQQNHQLSHLLTSFGPFLSCFMKTHAIPNRDTDKWQRAAIFKCSWSSYWLRQNLCGGTWEFAFLTSSQVLLIMLFSGLLFENYCTDQC